MHIGNPEFKQNKDSGFFGGDLIDWEFDFQGNFKFLEKYKSDFVKLLDLAIENSPNKQTFFLTDIQANDPTPKYRRISSLTNFWKVYEDEGLEWNTLYAINVEFLKNSLYSEIDGILWNDWDPIGINDYGGPSDEYRSYLPEIHKLLKETNEEEKIAKHLDSIVAEQMGMSSNMKENLIIARLLLEKKREYE